jgi:hypothetical protein
MALFKNPFGGNIVANLAIGVGVAILAPFVVPLVARIVKPAAKGAVKGGLLLSEMVTGRGTTGGETDGGKGRQSETTAERTKRGVAHVLAVKIVKSGIAVYEKGREVLSEAGEGVRESVAGAKTEMAAPAEGNPVGEAGEGGSPLESPKRVTGKASKRTTGKAPKITTGKAPEKVSSPRVRSPRKKGPAKPDDAA